jgi:catechol 2,3-dioxygenase-like lactoylglutathione lyase family enzyme
MMGLFRTDSVVLGYSNVEAAKQWWIDTFGCKVVRVPQDWDNPLPSDVALTLPGDSKPTILLNAQSEVEQAHFERPSPVASVIFCDKLKKAYEHLSSRGVPAGPIQDGRDMQFFEIRDVEGHLIEICEEP